MSTSRSKLFLIQSLLTILSILLIGFILIDNITHTNMLKIVLSPFSAILFLFFLLFIFNRSNTYLRDDNIYSVQSIAFSFILLGIILLVTIIGLDKIIVLFQTIEEISFLLSCILSVVAFIILRIRTIYTMAIVTGIAQGITIYVTFIY